MQSADDVAADNLTVNQPSQSECTAPSTMSSHQGGASTAGSSNATPVRALDLLGNNFDHQSFVNSEFRRAKVQLPLIDSIMAEPHELPVQHIDETDGGDSDSESEERHKPDGVEHEGCCIDGDEDYDPNDE